MEILKKIINIIFNILIIIVLILIILSVYYIFQMKIQKKDNASIFGYAFFEVATGSMSGTIEIGDVVIVRNTKDVEENDIIVYKENDNYITHRLIKKQKDKYITRGDANNSEDAPIDKEQVYGIVEKVIPKVGVWKKVLFSKEVLILGVILVLIIGILISLKNKTEDKND